MHPIKSTYWPIIIFLPIFYLIGILFLANNIVNCDVSQFLYISERMVQGDRLYRDILEFNMPLIAYLGIPAVYLGYFFHLSKIIIFYIYVIVLIISLPLFLCWKLLPRAFPAASIHTLQMLFLSLLFFLMLYSVGNFGQREHLLLALIMPYILISIIRALETPINNTLALLIGILAGIGLALKPHFLILPLSIELYLTYVERISIRPYRPENLGIIVVYGIYGIFFLILYNAYLILIPIIFKTYYHLANERLLFILLSKECLLWLFATIIVLFIKLTDPDRKAIKVLYLVSTVYLMIAIIQRKWYPYHVYPALLTLLLFFTFIFFRWTEMHPRIFDRGYLSRTKLSIVFLCLLTLLGSCKLVRNYLMYYKSDEAILMRLAKTYAQGHPIFVFSPIPFALFRIIPFSNTSWKTHYPSLWPMQRPLPGNANSTELKALLNLHLEPMDDLERSVVETTIADLRANPPYLLIFDESVGRWSSGKEPGEYNEFFSQVPEFSEFMKSYVSFAQVGVYSIFLPKKIFESLNK